MKCIKNTEAVNFFQSKSCLISQKHAFPNDVLLNLLWNRLLKKKTRLKYLANYKGSSSLLTSHRRKGQNKIYTKYFLSLSDTDC